MRKISAQDWRQLFALLDTALELSPLERASWLATLEDPPELRNKLCELLALEARHETGEFLQQLPGFTLSAEELAIATPTDAMAPGTQVGPYRLITRLGRGGMSSVWVAVRTDGLLKRRVALKLPHVSWGASDLAGRMARERDILASLEHPNIARLYDAGLAADGRPFLALELVDGKPVDEYCAGHAVDLRGRVTIALQIVHAVSYAHSRMIVHRDLKPSNILVDHAGQVRLLDFGISKLLEQDAALATQATQFGGLAFTPDYASPEQFRGEPVTASTDIYSLGVVAYQLFSGALPFSSRAAGTPAELALRPDPLPPSKATNDRTRAHALLGDLDTIVLKALKGAAAERYPTMQAIGDDLERYLRGEPVLARRDSAWYRARKFASRNRPALRAVAAAVVVTVTIAVGFIFERSRQQASETARAIEMTADAMARTGVPRTLPTRDKVAYHEYLQARGTMIRPTEDNLREVMRLTQSAIERDPGFAQAYAVLAGANILFLDNGYAHPNGLTLAEASARKALSLNPLHHGANATLGAIAAHRGDWLSAEIAFRRSFELDDGTGRIYARYAEAVLSPTGRLREALKLYRTEQLRTPTAPRGAMQVAWALAMQLGHDTEAINYVDIAMSNGWPGTSRDVAELNALVAQRAGRSAEAAEQLTSTLPPAARQAGGDETVRLLHEALASPGLRRTALDSLEALNARGANASMDTFPMLMFSMRWYTALGDLDHAYLTSGRWIEESARVGRSGNPWLAQLWLPEMSAFRGDPRFAGFANRMGFMGYWRKYGPPDDCELRGSALKCNLPAR